MMNKTILFLSFITISNAYSAQFQKSEITYLNQSEASIILSSNDLLMQTFSPLDKALRANKKINDQDFVTFQTQGAESFSPEDQDKIALALNKISSVFKMELPLPKNIKFIKSNNQHEFGFSYTKDNIIILNQNEFETSNIEFTRLIAHELFHVMTRHLPAIRTDLFKLINFTPIGTFDDVSEDIDPKRVTNPDAFYTEYAIDITSNGEVFTVTPFILATHSIEEINFDKDFDFGMKLVNIESDEEYSEYAYDEDSKLKIFEPKNTNYTDLVGQNTNYIIHPEEVMAENFSLMIITKVFPQEITVKNPSLLKSIETYFEYSKKFKLINNLNIFINELNSIFGKNVILKQISSCGFTMTEERLTFCKSDLDYFLKLSDQKLALEQLENIFAHEYAHSLLDYGLTNQAITFSEELISVIIEKILSEQLGNHQLVRNFYFNIYGPHYEDLITIEDIYREDISTVLSSLEHLNTDTLGAKLLVLTNRPLRSEILLKIPEISGADNTAEYQRLLNQRVDFMNRSYQEGLNNWSNYNCINRGYSLADSNLKLKNVFSHRGLTGSLKAINQVCDEEMIQTLFNNFLNNIIKI